MREFKIVARIVLLWGCLLFIPLGQSLAQNKDLKKVTFLPMWVPQPQFAGYYMAKEKGIYARHGLDVTIVTGGFTQDVLGSLKSGTVTFGTMFLYSGVMERARGTKIVNIAQIFQQSAIMFVAKKKSGIKTLQDFNGKKIGIWRTTVRELTTGFLSKHHIKAEIIPFNNAINLFLDDAVDVTVMMNYNEYKRMINSGVNPDEVTVFPFAEYGMDFPEDGIYCMENTIAKDPGLCREFVDASIEGWDYALSHADETTAVISKYKILAKVPANVSHSSWMLNRVREIIHPPNKPVQMGTLLKSDFDSLADFLFDNAFIASKPSFQEFFRTLR
ncbi:MAG TPA: ABC transporter substrate-binding protein [Bacteroidota bacterium]|nr:ABC transporter substrate-binding protein [Bacteroidota bacterium]